MKQLSFPRIARAVAGIGLMLAVAAAPDEHGHDHAPPATNPADDHDHGEHADEIKLSQAAIEAHGVRLGLARELVLRQTVVAPARVAFNAEAMAHVGSVVRGRVVAIKARVGDVVKKDAELLVVESPELGQAQSEFIQKRAAADIAAAAVEPAKVAYERAQALFEKDQGVSLAEVQKRQAEVRAAQGAADAAKAACAAAENALHLLGMSQGDVEKLASSGEINPRFSIRAPIDGSVIQREVTLGELVSPDRDALLILADTTTCWVLADVPEARLGEIEVGSPASVEIAANRGTTIEGRVSHIAASIDPQTRSARVRIEVQNHAGALRPGMFARVSIAAGAESDKPVLAIPIEAVQTIDGQTCIFVPVPGEANTFAKQPVEIGRPVGGMAPVISGICCDEELVVAGSFILKAELGKSHASHAH